MYRYISYTWVGATPGINTGWRVKGLKAAP